ncbi:hypothetical protein CPT_Spivey_041 [Klebsiella phage Spivey]|uniref:Uncharacterized protein n=1 Tax=Klebsiella phage Spivey TaxID=2562542 RepID=A0A4D5ZE38_9CAUD|nr:hypothetical protein CPT_Spivey_165 [Klebsiella phage Spivey]
MFASLVTIMLLKIFQFGIVFFSATWILIRGAIYFRRTRLARVARWLLHFVFGIFGVFRCPCEKKRGTGFCWLWLGLENCFSLSLALLFGMIVLAVTLAFIPLMYAGGVTSILTLTSPVLMYSVYPITLFFVRRGKHCN